MSLLPTVHCDSLVSAELTVQVGVHGCLTEPKFSLSLSRHFSSFSKESFDYSN